MTPRNGLYADPHVLVHRMNRRIVRDESGCWIFQGAVTSRGYASVGAGRRSKSILGHRLTVIARDGDLDPDMTVDHLCGVKRCVNPDHLEVVTRGENTRRYYCRGGVAPLSGGGFDFEALLRDLVGSS